MDIFDPKPTFCIGLSTNLIVLIFFRTVQGIDERPRFVKYLSDILIALGAVMKFPTDIAIASITFPPIRKESGISAI